MSVFFVDLSNYTQTTCSSGDIIAEAFFGSECGDWKEIFFFFLQVVLAASYGNLFTH